ncbi:PEX1 [Mytilus edulis]|uniref:Peroxisomal ATPase PEX1 n=1 Tax=Mytilus edulis TaxID=6550 RepID=A0A8S3T6Y2_MYTED|nr:PEX1 [Mytilus edulis]
MSCTVARVSHKAEKNCFIVLPKELCKTSLAAEGIQVYEVQFGRDEHAYFTATGESGYRDAELQVNGIYADRLGMKDPEVLVRPISAVSKSQRVFIEPQSVDDWEILEPHSGFVETNLMNQIRVVWKGQVFPFWVEKIVLFLKISSTEPDEKCVILNDDTEVQISPKVRSNSTGQNLNQSSISKDSVRKSLSPIRRNTSPIVPRKATSVQSRPTSFSTNNIMPNEIRPKKRSSWNPFRIVTGFLSATGGFDGGSHFYVPQTSVDSDEDCGSVSRTPSYSPEREESFTRSTCFGGLNFKFRVQSLKVDFDSNDELSSIESEIDGVSEDDFRSKLYLKQPNIVFVNSEDIQQQINSKNIRLPDTFYAKLTRLDSPKDIYARAEDELAKQKKEKQDKLDQSSDSIKSNRSDKKDKQLNCIVRVVILTKKGLHSKPEYVDLISHMLEEQPCLRGHVIVPDLLRRLMKLDVTRQIWLQSIDEKPYPALAFDLQPVTSLPRNFGNYQVQETFKKWVKETSSNNVPFVMFPGVMINMHAFKDTSIDMQVLYHEQKLNEREGAVYSLLHCDNLEDLSFFIKTPTSIENSKWPILPMLSYMDVKSIDPCFPKEKFEDMGGVEELAEEAIISVEICLSSKPLGDSMFRKITPGLRNGMILITGPKGSGKTMFAHALCREQAEIPNLAYILNIDCKPLRGKRPDTILKILQMAFDEAAWRQPSVILLDDLEHVVPAPSGPEAEMSGEAIYGSRVAEVLRDLLRREICDGTRIAVIATTVARTSINSLLVNSRGTHFVQTTLAINPPDKIRRRKIITSIIKSRPVINPVTLDKVDLDWLQCRTEGYVASDLMNLVSRALHAHWLKYGYGGDTEHGITLYTEEFKAAIEGFTPASIRNVSLHTAGELGWDDVGGLEDIRNILVETLQWPSKYPKLFSNCPLRLRSGLLLYGAPGTGKTLLAGVVAKECGLNFISIKGPELLNKYIGASEQAVRDTFLRAQSARPCILFFDEFDSIAPRRGHDNTGVTDRVVNQLLTQLDGVEGLQGVYVLAATSRPDLIDPALLRPGRLDKCLRCNLPDLNERKAILTALTRKIELGFDVDLDSFAEKCENFTGADFKALLYNAQLEAIHHVTGQVKRDKFDFSPQKSPSYLRTRRRSSSYGVLSKAAELEREQKQFKSDFIYMKNLNEGATELSEEMDDLLTQQVQQIRNRLKVHKNTEKVTTAESLFSPVATSKGQAILISQDDIQKALDKTRPSVPAEERLKYQHIYENFVSSRGGNFAQSLMDAVGAVGQKQTCA